MLSVATYPQPAVHEYKDGLRGTRKRPGRGNEDVEVVFGVGGVGGEGVMVGEIPPGVGSGGRLFLWDTSRAERADWSEEVAPGGRGAKSEDRWNAGHGR